MSLEILFKKSLEFETDTVFLISAGCSFWLLSFDIDIDDVAKINEEVLDLVNDLLPDGYYLEVTTLGIERELKNDDDLEKALGKYIYLKTYEKIESAFNLKEMYGYLESYTDNSINVNVINKTKTKLVTIEKSKIAKVRLAVKF